MPAKHTKQLIIPPAESSDDENELKTPNPVVPPVIANVVPPVNPILQPAAVVVPQALPPLFGAPMQVPLPPTKQSDSYHQLVYQGAEWQKILAQGTNLHDHFPAVEKKAAGDGLFSKTSALGAKLVGLLGLPTGMGDAIRPTLQFCCLLRVEYEPDSRLPARQKMWAWIVKSLRGNKLAPGPYHYLEVQM